MATQHVNTHRSVAVNHSNDQVHVWGLDNKVKFTAIAWREAANNSPVWQVPLLKPCWSALSLTRCYLKCMYVYVRAFSRSFSHRGVWTALGGPGCPVTAVSLNQGLSLKDTSIIPKHYGYLLRWGNTRTTESWTILLYLYAADNHYYWLSKQS